MMRGAINYFGRIQGGKAGASPKWAVTAEPTQESAKIVVAQRVAHLLDDGSVVLAQRSSFAKATADRDRQRYALVLRSPKTKEDCHHPKFVATPHIRVFQ